MKKIFPILMCSILTTLSAASSSDFSKVVQTALPSSVLIIAETDPFDDYYGEEPPRFGFVKPVFDYFWPPITKMGSGSIIDPSGYILTNAHVVSGGHLVSVFTNGLQARRYKAVIVGIDHRSDIAILKIKNRTKEAFPFLKIGDSNALEIGESVIAIGNPGGSFHCEATVSKGVISAKERNGWRIHDLEGFLQLDAPVNSGNSGGALLNNSGEIVGVVAWQYSHKEGPVGLNFAVPSYIAKGIASQLIANGEVEEGFLGVVLDLDPDLTYHGAGAVIEKVLKDSPAEAAGLKNEDIIVAINGTTISSALHFRNHIGILPPDTEITLIVERSGYFIKVLATLEEGDGMYSSKRGTLTL